MTNSSDHQLKVSRLIEKYELTGIGDELERRWTRSEDRLSLRDLADFFNRRILGAALETEGSAALDGEVENLYRLLTSEDITSGVRQQARNRIDRRGVDPDSLEGDFVSYQAVRTYLKNDRDATPPDTASSPRERVTRKRSTIQRLTTRLVTVTEQSLDELANASAVTLGDFEVLVAVRVHCSDCNTQSPVTELLAEGGCECGGE